MDFSFMKEKEWYSLDDDTKSKLIDLSFVDQVTTDPDWKKTPDDEKIALYDLYRKEADDFNIQSKPKPKDYGLVGDLAQGGLAAAKGVAGGMRMTDLDPEEEKNPVAKLGKYLSDLADVAEEKYDIFKPQARDDGFLMEGLRGTAQSIPASLTPFAGALAGGAVGGPIGAVIGGMGTLFGTFFAGTYQNTYEDAVEELEKKGIPEEKIHGIANKHALKSSSLEFGTELAGDLAAVTFFGLLGKNAVKNGIKSTIKELAGPGGAKKFLSAYAKTVPFEMGSEMVAGYGQAKSAQEAGLLTPSPGESAKQAIIPSILMPLLFGAGIHGADAYKAKSLYNDLNSEDKEKRFDAANKIAGRLDPEERKVWYETATEFIGQGKEIPLSKPIVDFASINAIRKGSASVEFLNKISDGLKSGSVTKDQVESLKSDRRFLEFSDQIDTILSDHETKNPSITDATTSDDAVNRFNQIINNALGGGPQKLDTGILSSIQRKRSELDNYLEEEGYNQSFDSEFEKRKKAAQYAGREVSRVEDIINTFKTTTDFKVRDQSQREINALFSEGVPFNEGLAELEKNIAEFKKHRSVEALERRQAKMSDQATETTTDKEFIQAQTDIRNGKFVPLEIMERHPSLLPEGETLLKGISVEDRREASVRALERRQANMKGLQVGILNIPSINREDKKPAKADTAIQEGVEGEPTPLEIITLSEKEISNKYPEYSKKQDIQKQKDAQPVKEIDSAIKVFQDELKDWESRDYKENKTTVWVGGAKDDLQSGPTSIGAANERRRKRNIESRQQSIIELEKAKERLNKGEDEKQILGELLDSQYLPLVDFARKRLGMKPTPDVPPQAGDVVPDTQSLEAEAKKYKSADEFISSIGELGYQGRSSKGISDLFKDGEGWFSKNRGVAVQFADMQKHNDIVQRDGESEFDTISNEELKGEVHDRIIISTNPKEVDISETLWNRNKERAAIAQAKKDGYDSLRIMQDGDVRDIVAFDKSQIKTKAELTDLWNKANPQEKPTTPAEGKQPWEMSRDEYVKTKQQALRDKAVITGAKTGKKFINKSLMSRANSEELIKTLEINHLEKTSKAIQDGKIDSHPDYPELGKQAPKADPREKIAADLFAAAEKKGFKRGGFESPRLTKSDIEKILKKHKTSLSEILSAPYPSHFDLIKLSGNMSGMFNIIEKPTLEEFTKQAEPAAKELKSADELIKQDLIRPNPTTNGRKMRRWDYRDEKGIYTTAPSKSDAVKRANEILLKKETVEKPEAKALWQMTREEVLYSPYYKKGDTVRHKKAVQKALNEGKPVPENVFKSYTGLKRPAPKEKPKTNKGIQGKKDTSYLSDSTEIEFQYEVIESGDLTASHDTEMIVNPVFPKELQPRDRTRKAALLWLQKAYADFKPRRLGYDIGLSDGAPAVAPDNNIVESGNGRTILLRKVYASEKKKEYTDWLEKNAADFGISDAEIKKMKEPILIRRRVTPVEDVVKYVRLANKPTIASYSSTEEAVMDASNLTVDDILLFRPSQDGVLTAASNKAFISRFLEKMSSEERGKYLTADGRANKQLVDRMQAAIFQKAYGSDELLTLATEEADPDIKNILNGLVSSVVDFVKAKAMDEKTTDELVEHVVNGVLYLRQAKKEYPDLKSSKTKNKTQVQLAQAMSQRDMFEGEQSYETQQVALFIAENIRSGKRIGEFLSFIGSELRQSISDLTQMDIFDKKNTLTSIDLINNALEKVRNKYEDQQQTLFDGRNEQGTEEAILQYGNRPGNEKSEQGGYPGRTTPEVPGKEGEINESQGLFGKEFGQQGELFTGGQKISKQKLPKSAKKKSKTDKLQGDLFGGMPIKEDQGDLFEYKPEQLEKVKFEELREKQTISTKSISRVDISKSGFVVRTIDDAAALLSHIGDEASENAYFLSLDKDGNVLEVLRHTIGTKSSSLIDATEAIGRSFNVPGIDRIVFAHNHPAATFKPSKSDKKILKRLEAISKLRNIEITPMLIGRDEYVVFDINSGEQVGNPIKNTIKKADIPIKERVFEKRVGKNDPVYKQAPETAARLKNEDDGFLLLDGANKEVGFLPFPSGLAQKEITARVIAATQKTGAGAIIVNNKPPANAIGRDDFLRKLSDALLSNNIVIYDIFSYDKNGVVGHDPQDVRREPYYSLGAVDKDDIQFSTTDDLTQAFPIDQEETKDFKNWSGGNEVIEGYEIADAELGKGYVFKVYHGTTNEFSIFDPTVKGNKEGQFGSVSYFTSDEGDADINYAGEGPDLTNRIERRLEQLEDELGEYDEEDIIELAKEYNLEFDSDKETYPEGLPRAIATKELSGGSPKNMYLYVKSDNPVYIGGSRETWIENQDTEQYREDATADVLSENDADESQIEEYEDEIQDRIWEMSQDDELKIFTALEKAIRDSDADVLAADVYAELEIYDSEISATELEKALRNSTALMDATDETGELVQSHIIGQVFKNLGYDSIVLQNANERFKNMDMGGETSHVHVFEETPANIKSATNNIGTYSKTNPDIYFQTDTQPGTGLSIEQIQAQFPGTKTSIQDGIISIRFPNGKGVRILSTRAMPDGTVQYATKSGRMSSKGVIFGAAINNTIYLNPDLADKKTLWHEIEHILENAGIITAKEKRLLNTHINLLVSKNKSQYKLNKNVNKDLSEADNRKAQLSEDRANAFSQLISDREKYRGTKVGLIIQKIMDFVDGLIYIGRQSLRKMARDVESGKIFSRKSDAKKPGIVNIGKGKAWGIQVNKEFQVDTWHGSPHYIDGEFRNDKIGTGEGAQAFGWGLYFTESRGVGKSYAKGKYPEINIIMDTLKTLTDEQILAFKGYYLDTGSEYGLSEDAKNIPREEFYKYVSDNLEEGGKLEIDAVANAFDVAGISLPKNAGHLYKTTLHKGKSPDDYNYIEWDKDITINQARAIKQAIFDEGLDKKFGYGQGQDILPVFAGRDIYRALSNVAGTDKDASRILKEAGISGIKYPAGTLSGGNKSGAYNYVVFDPKDITIEEHIQFLFAGPEARGADKSKAFEAQQMRDAGVPRLKVWKSTGWYEMIPGSDIWSFEIDDSDIKIDSSKYSKYGQSKTIPQGTKLGDVATGRVIDAYPFLKNITVFISIDRSNSGNGHYIEGKKKISIEATSVLNAKGILVHEIQHAVQGFEGFPFGGNPEEFAKEIAEKKARLRFLENNDPVIKQVNNEFSAGVNKIIDSTDDMDFATQQISQLEKRLIGDHPEWKEVRTILSETRGVDATGTRQYKKLTGEAQSRLTQERRDMTPKQRRNAPPWVTLRAMLTKEGLLQPGQKPEDVLISRDSGGVAMSEFPVIRKDKNENNIVYETEDRRITVDKPGKAGTVVLWAKQTVNGKDYWRKAGNLYTNIKTKKLPGESKMKDYISISSIEIEKAYRGEGLGKKMYQVLIDHAPENIEGIISHTPNRVNKKQVPAIYRSLGGYEVGDWQVIPINRGRDSGGVAMSEPTNILSKAFKKFFQGSKVVDKSGKPLPVYHGTSDPTFTKFKSRLGLTGQLGFWFASTKEAANKFATKRYADIEPGVLDVYLSIENPKVYNSWAELIEDVKGRKGVDIDGKSKSLRAKLIRDGYDGIQLKNSETDFGGLRDDYIAFKSTQIKSIYNQGAWDSTNPDIRFQISEDRIYTPGQQAFKKAGGFGQRDKVTIKERVEEAKVLAGTKLRQGIVDQFHSLNKILKDKQAWMMAHLTKSDTGVLMTAINVGMPILDPSGAVDIKEGSKSLKEILAPLGNELDDFLAWIAANRSEKLMTEGREHLFTPEQIAAGKTLNQGREELYDTARREFEELGAAITDIPVKTNLVNEEEAQRWREEGFYVPYYRMLEEQETSRRGPGNINGLTNQQAYKKLKGGKSQLDDLLTNTLLNWNHLISAGLRNQAGKKALESAEEMGMATRLTGKAFWKEEENSFTLEGIEDTSATISLIDEVYHADADGGFVKTFETLKTAKREVHKHLVEMGLMEAGDVLNIPHGKNSVYVRDNGREIWYELDQTPEGQLVLDSIMSLSYEGSNTPAMKAMRAFKRGLTRGVTASPGFKIRNLMRDSLHAPAVANVSRNPLKNIAVGFKNTATMKRMEAGGGAFSQEGYIHGNDPDAMKRLVGVAQRTILNTMNRVSLMWHQYENFGNTLENINRVAGFQKDLAEGKTLLEANFNARDQLDFARSGSFASIRVLTQTIPFLNARIQGLDKLSRAAMDPAQRNQFGQVIATYTIASVALMLAMSGDDDYDEAQEWEKRTYHLFKIPGVDRMFRIPRPFEVGAIAYMNEQMARQFLDANSDIDELGSALYHTLSDTFAISAVPQAFKPLLEIYANKDSFRNTKIESIAMQHLSKKERSSPWTSEVAKGTSAAMSAVLPDDVILSPVQIQHLVKAYTGWAGATTLASIDFLIKKVNGDISPETKLSEYTWNPVSSFVRDEEAKSSKYVNKFYENMSELDMMWGDIRKYRDTPGGKAVTLEQRNKLRYRKLYNKISKQLSAIRSEERRIYTDPNMTAIQKRMRLSATRRKKNELAKKATTISEDVF